MSGADQNGGPAVDLRPALDADRDRIEGWLRLPEISAWWGSRGSAQAEIALALASPSAVCRIIEAGGVPVGYAQAVDVASWGATRPAEVPLGAYELDLFIGSTPHRGMGIGPRALGLMMADVFASTLAVACVAVLSVRNEAAVRAHERHGFKWVRVVTDPLLGPCWVMLRQRGA